MPFSGALQTTSTSRNMSTVENGSVGILLTPGLGNRTITPRARELERHCVSPACPNGTERDNR